MCPQGASSRPRENGFTLIELLVVLVVIGLASAVLYPRIASLTGRSLDATANRLSSSLRQARLEAMHNGRAGEVGIDALRMLLHEGQSLRSLGDDTEATILFLPTGASSGHRYELSGDAGRRVIEVDWLTGRVALVDG